MKRNVRFGGESPPFGAPSFPDWEDDSLQSPERSTIYIQIDPQKLSHPPAGGNPLEDPEKSPTSQTEDCLFLDIYVPKWLLTEDRANTRLPVTVWIYSKAALKASEYSTIFIAGNYRISAFGWPVGDYLQKAGQPNAGLYDQAILFEWVQKYIDLVRGNNESVSAWGESAGAGSISHHLVREGGTVDTKFQTFAAQSPGFEWAWDNSPGGKLDTMEYNFPAEGTAFHGTDLIPQFTTSAQEAENLLLALDVDKLTAKALGFLINGQITEKFQNFFASLTTFGDPNRPGDRVYWQYWPPVKDDGDEFEDVMEVTFEWEGVFRLRPDSKNSRSKCSFWSGIARDIVATKATSVDSGIPLEGQFSISNGNEP